MFEPTDSPRIFALPPGVDFPVALLEGLDNRMAGSRPEDLARVHLVVNTRRMTRRIRDWFDAGPARLLPRLSLVTDPLNKQDLADIPSAVSPLRRRLELTQLISKLLDQQPDLAARASVFDLADSLAELLDEMQGEGVSAETIQNLDVSDLSGHWARTQTFIGIASQFVGPQEEHGMDGQTRQRMLVQNLIARWETDPPQHPVILAGSTGSRGTTLKLMAAIARLPQGAVVLPGYDFDQPQTVWSDLHDAFASEDHPQYRFRNLMTALNVAPADVLPWSDAQPPCVARNRLVSLALRPAPTTDAWMKEGPQLSHLPQATANVTLVEAKSPHQEALAIALRLRKSAETGQTAALITPDRMLTRQVSAALDRWNIVPDDSAGLPLQLSPPGRFLRQVARLFFHRLTGETLLTLLKHPLCHGGGDRGLHLLNTRDLELHLRRKGPPFPDAASMFAFGTGRDQDNWISWVSRTLCGQVIEQDLPLAEWVSRLRLAAETISAGSTSEGGATVWDKNAGQKALSVLDGLEKDAQFGGQMTARDFGDLLGSLLSQEEVRDRDAPHSKIMIWGTLEARVQGADLLILGGLNEGSWPEAARPDPWLNRQLRAQAGLLLPERRIGLSAHDFQQAVAAPEVWMTRSVRSEDSATVASRWVNRLTNLLQGLKDQDGPDILGNMKKRGDVWLNRAIALEKSTPVPAAHRPSPRPPVSARPRQMSVTEIKRLIRDPYAIYAKHVLRLRALDPLAQTPDALLRGIVVHDILEQFIRSTIGQTSLPNRAQFLEMARELLNEHVAWPTARRLWLARLDRIADEFLQHESARRKIASPVLFEATARSRLQALDFTLVARADRIDSDPAGRLHIYDYKTGRPPTTTEQAKFDKQLLLEAAMAEQDGFQDLGPTPVSQAVFISVGSTYKEVPAPLDTEPPAKIWGELALLISAYMRQDQGYTARRMLHKDSDIGDFDHLARFGEWDRTTEPTPEDLE